MFFFRTHAIRNALIHCCWMTTVIWRSGNYGNENRKREPKRNDNHHINYEWTKLDRVKRRNERKKGNTHQCQYAVCSLYRERALWYYNHSFLVCSFKFIPIISILFVRYLHNQYNAFCFCFWCSVIFFSLLLLILLFSLFAFRISISPRLFLWCALGLFISFIRCLTIAVSVGRALAP